MGSARAPLSPFVLVKSAGEMGSAIAWRLHMANMGRICMLDLENPLCVRRRVSYCTALHTGATTVEGVEALAARDPDAVEGAWRAGKIAVMRTTDWNRARKPSPEVVIDAILAKRNLGTRKDEARLVIALGPGFEAGVDCHFVIETNRGHDLGRIIASGSAQANTGDPGDIAGFTTERVLRAPASGPFRTTLDIGSMVRKGEVIGQVAGQTVSAGLDGVLRGLIRPGTEVLKGVKLGDVDPRGRREYCDTISDKARSIAGAVLEAIMRELNRPVAAAPC